MKTIKIMATINEEGQLMLDRPLMSDRNSRVEVIILIPESSEIQAGQSDPYLLQDFEQAWHEAMTGQTIPVSQMWEGIEDV